MGQHMPRYCRMGTTTKHLFIIVANTCFQHFCLTVTFEIGDPPEATFALLAGEWLYLIRLGMLTIRLSNLFFVSLGMLTLLGLLGPGPCWGHSFVGRCWGHLSKYPEPKQFVLYFCQAQISLVLEIIGWSKKPARGRRSRRTCLFWSRPITSSDRLLPITSA